MNQKNHTFEENMHRLEQIVRAMERGDVPLEESLKLFQEGTSLVEACNIRALTRLASSSILIAPCTQVFTVCTESR